MSNIENIHYMTLVKNPKQKWKTIDEKSDLELSMWDDGEILYVNFEGSDSLTDYKYNFSFFPVKRPYKNMEDVYYVHSGFATLYHIARDDIHNKFLMTKGVKKIVILGHSLGAALATLCYADFKWHKEHEEKYKNLEIIGFTAGCPRVGWLFGFKNFKKYTTGLIRLVNNNDMIPRLPFKIFGYRHVGEERILGKRDRWPLKASAIYHHIPKSYLNHAKYDNFKDDAENNPLYRKTRIGFVAGYAFIGIVVALILFGLFA